MIGNAVSKKVALPSALPSPIQPPKAKTIGIATVDAKNHRRRRR
jgi:hypothetical protein